MKGTFERVILALVLIGTAMVLFGAGAFIGEYQARKELQETAAKNCGAGFDKITGEFIWIGCPTPVDTVIDPETPDEPIDQVPESASVEVAPSATEKPNEPVY